MMFVYYNLLFVNKVSVLVYIRLLGNFNDVCLLKKYYLLISGLLETLESPIFRGDAAEI